MTHTLGLRPVRPAALPTFAVLAAAVVAAGIVALDRSSGAAVVTTAVTIDLVVIIPALHYLLLVRGRGLPAITILPVVFLSLAVGAIILPSDDRALYDLLVRFVIPLEMGAAAYVLYRLRLGWLASRSVGTDDILERYRAGARAALPTTVPSVGRAADAVAFEAAVAWFATRSWLSRPQAPAGATAFTGHRMSGYGGVVLGLLMVVAVEVMAVHLLVASWSTSAAWVLTALSVYGAVWLVGDLRAVRLRPSWVDRDRICMRVGLRWTVTVPIARVRRARKLAAGEAAGDALRVALPNSRRVLLELDAPVTALGVYGIRRTATAIELGVDDPDGFLRRIASV